MLRRFLAVIRGRHGCPSRVRPTVAVSAVGRRDGTGFACARDVAAIECLEGRRLLATFPGGFTDSLIASGIVSPTAMDFAPDGRLFITQQGGQVRVVKNGQLLPAPFTTVDESSSGERGLLGVAVDPDFASNRYVYVFYTARNPTIHNRVSRFTASGDVAAAGSERVLLDLPDVGQAIWHMGGALRFGPDGKLYVSVGDYQVPEHAQNPSVPMGKILRINKDGSIPTDNPFYARTTGVNRAIWATGLRNPFTTAFQPGTGRFYINDVGSTRFEEVNEGVRGANYGWPAWGEGFMTDGRFTNPVYAYGHDDGRAVIGGAFYNPPSNNFPSAYRGKYFFADFGRGWVRTIDPATKSVAPFATGLDYPVSLTLAPDGSLWYLGRGAPTGGQPDTGSIHRVRYASAAQPPSVTSHPQDRFAAAGQSATFSVGVAGSPPFTYQWQRNRVDISGAAGASYTRANLTTADDGARFRVVVRNAHGSATSNEATLDVTANAPPQASLLSPATGTMYAGGQRVSYSGAGADPETGDLPAGAFTWRVDLHHDDHAHPFVPPTTGSKSGSFVIPTTGETSPDVWYRIHLTVTDPAGLTRSVFRDVQPRRATIRLEADVAGMQISLDGEPRPAPLSVTGVAGLTRRIEAPAVHTAGGVTYEFESWSDGGARAHAISFPTTNTTYTARYRATTGNPAAVYVSDLAPVGTPVNGWGPVESDRSNRGQAAGDGRTITLNGVTYAKGLGVHARSEVVYDLAGSYGRFVSDVGVDDEVGAAGSVVFQVWAGGDKLFDSGVMTGTSRTKTVDVSVAGRRQLKLVVTDAGDGHTADHADWAGARLAPAGGAAATYQAEAAARSGAAVSTEHGGYTGAGFVDFVAASGEWVEWTVNAATAGPRRLDFRYALGAAARRMRLTVNGSVLVGDLSFGPTGGWGAWDGTTVQAVLRAGANKVQLTSIGCGGPNVDVLTVR